MAYDLQRMIEANAQYQQLKPEHNDVWLDAKLAAERWQADPTDDRRDETIMAFRNAHGVSERLISTINEVLAAGDDAISGAVRESLMQSIAAARQNQVGAEAVIAAAMQTGTRPVRHDGRA